MRMPVLVLSKFKRKHRKRKRPSLLILLFLVSNVAFSKTESKSLNVCTLKLAGGMVDDKNHGFLIDILKEALENKFSLNIVVLPIQRSARTFKEKKCDLLAAAMAGDLKTPRKTELPTGLQDHYRVYARDRKLIEKHYNKAGLKSSDQSKNKLKVIVVRSWKVPKYLLKENTVFKAQNMPTAIKMLLAKRADYLIGFNFLVSSYLKKEKIKSIESIESLKYEEKQVVFVANPPHAVPILREYKKNMLKMVKSGRYEKLITKHKVPKWLLLEKHKLLNHLEALK